MKIEHPESKFYGTTSIGKKGQMVVPKGARDSLDVKEGEKLLVLGVGKDMIIITKFSQIEEFAAVLSEKLKAVKSILNKNK